MKLFVGLILGLATLGLSLFVGIRWELPRYLSSQEFRKRIEEKTAGLVDAPSGYQPLLWQDSTVTSSGFLARGKPDRALQVLQARNLKARLDWSDIWHRHIVVNDFAIDRLQAALSLKTAKEVEHNLVAPPELMPPVETNSAFRVELRRVMVNHTTILWGKNADEFGAFREVALCLWPVGTGLAAYGDGGTLQIGSLPEAGVKPFQLRYRKPALDIEWGALTLGGPSEVNVAGQIRFTQPSQISLAIGFRQCPISVFLKPEMRTKFDGVFESDMRVLQTQDEPAHFEGPVRFAGATLKNVAGLAKLAALTNDPRFKVLHFQELRGDCVYSDSKLIVHDFMAEDPGLFQVEGTFRIYGQEIRGTVQLGISAKVLAAFPGAREEVFTNHRNGYYWTNVRLGGTTDQPEQDLKDRLVSAAEKHPLKVIAPPVSKTVETLTKPFKSFIDGLKEIF